MNSIPGPRLVVSWLVWLWALMYLATVCQVAGMVGTIASVGRLVGIDVSNQLLAVGIGVVTATLLAIGRYRLVQTFSTAMVVMFTACTIVATVMLQFTPYAVTGEQIVRGFSFNLPATFTVAFAAFGIIGVGASELVYYPYWCLEKGYARNVGPFEDSPAWFTRARKWLSVLRLDAWISCVIYTGATVAFFILGAAVLAAKGLNPSNDDVIPVLSHMYEETFGAWSLGLFLAGAVVVLYSTVFVATASNTRLMADALAVFKLVKYQSDAQRQKVVRLLCVIVPAAWVTIYLIWEKPVTLILVGAIAQGLMLPFLGLAALWLNHRRTDRELQSGVAWRVFLWLSALCMMVVGAYQVISEITKIVSPAVQ
jgi:Mn2+/Fe2+ NRAMP family transporter